MGARGGKQRSRRQRSHLLKDKGKETHVNPAYVPGTVLGFV